MASRCLVQTVMLLICIWVLCTKNVLGSNNLFELVEDEEKIQAFTEGKMFPDPEKGVERTRGLGPTSSWIDFDQDGDLDIFIVAMEGTNSLFRCDGVGIYTRIIMGDLVTDTGASTSITWGDVDNDGDLDAFVTNDNNKNALYIQNGTDTFVRVKDESWGSIVHDTCYMVLSHSTAVSVRTACSSEDAEFEDINGDGWLDLLVVNGAMVLNQLFLQVPGEFRFEQYNLTEGEMGFAAVSYNTDLEVFDVNYDGDLDVIVTDGFGAATSVFIQVNGSFYPDAESQLTAFPSQFMTDIDRADFNNDGIDDFLFTSGTGHHVLMYNNGNGSYSQDLMFSYTLAMRPALARCRSPGIGDLNGDGRADIYFTAFLYSSKILLENLGPLGWRVVSNNELESIAIPLASSHFVDLNSDGLLDVATFAGSWNYEAYASGSVPVHLLTFLNTGNWSFMLFPMLYSPVGLPYEFKSSVAAADFDGDGDMDFITSSWGEKWSFVTYTNDGDGTFSRDPPTVPIGPSSIYWYTAEVLVDDFDVDGDTDAFAVGWGTPSVLLTNIGGHLYPTNVLSDAILGSSGALCDLDGDGKKDVIIVRPLLPMMIYLVNETGHFNLVNMFTHPMGGLNGFIFSASYAACGDYNDDGYQDVFITTSTEAAPLPNILFRNDGNLQFSVVEIPALSESGYSSSASFYDYDQDGDLDLLIVNTDGEENDLFVNTDGQGSFVRTTTSEVSASAKSSTIPIWGDFNLDNRDDVIVLSEEGSHDLYLNTGDGKHELATTSHLDVHGSFKGGVAVDVDGDGDLDLVLVRAVDVGCHYRSIFIYENKFEVDPVVQRETVQLPQIPPGSYTTGHVWIDVTNDGIEDLVLSVGSSATTTTAPIVVLRANSNGELHFYKHPVFSQLLGNFAGISVQDMDGDGLLDIYISSSDVYSVIQRKNFVFRNVGGGMFLPITNSSILGDDAVSTANTLWHDWDGDGDEDVLLINTVSQMKMFRNDGGWNFTHVVGPWDYMPALIYKTGLVFDYNEDGLMDIFIMTMFETPNFLFQNHGGLMFSMVAGSPLTETRNSALGALQIDLDLDGDLDLFVWTMHLNSQYRRDSEINRAYLNQGSGNWTEAKSCILAQKETFTSHALYEDLDGDGMSDLFLANGDMFYGLGEHNTLYLGTDDERRFVEEDDWKMLASASGTTFATAKTFGRRSYLFYDHSVRNIESFLLVSCSNRPNETCEQCPPGMFGVKGRCLKCPRGTYNDQYGQTSCVSCESGPYYQDEAGQSSCKLCPPGLYVSKPGAYSRDQCEICPRGTDMDRRAAPFEACPCLPNFYRFTLMGDCYACPSDGSASCVDGLLTPSEGYWWNRTSTSVILDSPVSILECPLEGSCLGGENSTCAEGHEGTACIACSENYYMLFGSCTECSSTGATIAIAVVIMMVVLLIVYILIRSNEAMAYAEVGRLVKMMQKIFRQRERDGGVSSSSVLEGSPVVNLLSRNSYRSASVVAALSQLKIVVAYYQESTALLNVFQDSLPQAYIKWAKEFQITNFDLFTFSSPHCVDKALTFDYLDGLTTSLGLMGLLLFVLFMAWLVRRIQQWYYKVPRLGFIHPDSKRSWERYRAFTITCFRLALFVMYIMYIPICVRIFNIFKCQDLGTESYLEVDYSVNCQSPKYDTYKTISYWLVALFALGLPLAVGILLWYRKRLVEKVLRFNYGEQNIEIPADRVRNMWVPVKDRLKATHHKDTCYGSDISVFERCNDEGSGDGSPQEHDEATSEAVKLNPMLRRPSKVSSDRSASVTSGNCVMLEPPSCEGTCSMEGDALDVDESTSSEEYSTAADEKIPSPTRRRMDIAVSLPVTGTFDGSQIIEVSPPSSDDDRSPASQPSSADTHDVSIFFGSGSRSSIDCDMEIPAIIPSSGRSVNSIRFHQTVEVHSPMRKRPSLRRISSSIGRSQVSVSARARKESNASQGSRSRPPLKREEFEWIHFDFMIFKARMTSLALSFLYENYREGAYYWEVFEMLRRLLMTSVIVYLGTTPEARLLSAILISFCSIAVLQLVKPFRRQRDFQLTRIAFLSIFLQLWISQAILTNVFKASIALAAVYSLLNSIVLVVLVVVVLRALRKRYVKLAKKLKSNDNVDKVRRWDVMKGVFAFVNAKSLKKNLKELTEEGLDLA